MEWLQGQLTQDVGSMSVGSSNRTAVLNATGQLLADGAVWILNDEVILGLDRFAEAAAEALAAKIVMEDVDIQAITEAAASVVGAPTPPGAAEYTLPIEHAGSPGYDVIPASEAGPFPAMKAGDYETARVEAAIPLAGIDYDTRTLAMEMGPHFVATRIAFGKGCYTGQEIVERIRSRGRTNRQWVGLRSPEPIPDVPEIRITSRAESPRFGYIALAFVPTKLADVGTQIGNAVVTEIPFK